MERLRQFLHIIFGPNIRESILCMFMGITFWKSSNNMSSILRYFMKGSSLLLFVIAILFFIKFYKLKDEHKE